MIIPKSFNLQLVSLHRTEIMGFAAVCIILCHANVSGVVTPKPIHYLLSLGNVGVDIFLLLSGMGMYFSFEKRGIFADFLDSNIHWGGVVRWYLSRYKRILTPYFVITTPWWIYFAITRNTGISDFFLNLSTIGYWIKHYGAWYVALLIPLYFITP